MSRWALTETYSPTAIDSAPAVSPAMPAVRMANGSLVAPATPITMPAVDTIPSLAPRTAARRLFSRPWWDPAAASAAWKAAGSPPARDGESGTIIDLLGIVASALGTEVPVLPVRLTRAYRQGTV